MSASPCWHHADGQMSTFSATRTHFYPSSNLCPCSEDLCLSETIYYAVIHSLISDQTSLPTDSLAREGECEATRFCGSVTGRRNVPWMFHTENPMAGPVLLLGSQGSGKPKAAHWWFRQVPGVPGPRCRTHGQDTPPLGEENLPRPCDSFSSPSNPLRGGLPGAEKRDPKKEIPLIFLVKKGHQ